MKNADKMFRVIPRGEADIEKAKILEMLVNRPDVVARIMDEVEKWVKENMNKILFGEGIERFDWRK